VIINIGRYFIGTNFPCFIGPIALNYLILLPFAWLWVYDKGIFLPFKILIIKIKFFLSYAVSFLS